MAEPKKPAVEPPPSESRREPPAVGAFAWLKQSENCKGGEVNSREESFAL